MPPLTPWKRADIQVLRAVAVLSVVVFHLDESWLIGGFLGVDVFFVISGFLITGIIVRGLNSGKFSISEFYLRRIKRLFPALALVLWTTTLVGIACLPPIPFRGLMEHLSWAALQVSNFSFMGGVDYFGADTRINPVLHTWSLGVEEQFYLTWAPALLLAFRLGGRKRKKAVEFRPLVLLVTVIVFSFATEYLTREKFGDNVSFFSPVSRAWQLGMGGLAALFFSETRRVAPHLRSFLNGFGILVILASVFLLSSERCADPLWRLIPCLGAFLVVSFPFAHSARPLLPVLGGAVYVGDISYSLYLWHWPVICLMPYVLLSREGPIYLISTILTFSVLASLSYHFCEKPCMENERWKRFFSLRSSAVVTLLCMVAGGGFALRSEGDASWRFNRGVAAAEEKAWRKPTAFREFAEKRPGEDPLKLAGDAEVLLIGDSHAGHFVPLVDAWSKEKKLSFFPYWATGYVSIATQVKLRLWDEDGKVLSTNEVENGNPKLLLKAIVESETIKVVFIAQRTAAYTHVKIPTEKYFVHHRSGFVDEMNPDSGRSTDLVYEEQIEHFVDAVIQSGKKVVLIGQIPPLLRDPKPGASMLDRLLNRDWKEDDIYLPEEMAKRGNLEHKVYSKMAARDEVRYLPTRELIVRTYGEGGQFFYDDASHISYQGAMYLRPALSDLLHSLSLE